MGAQELSDGVLPATDLGGKGLAAGIFHNRKGDRTALAAARFHLGAHEAPFPERILVLN